MVAINGKDYAAEGKNLASVLTEMKYDFRTIAVEINEEIVSKKFYEETILNDGDVVEVVSFVGGG